MKRRTITACFIVAATTPHDLQATVKHTTTSAVHNADATASLTRRSNLPRDPAATHTHLRLRVQNRSGD